MKFRPQQRWAGRSESVTDVYHHLVCRHQVEVEVWPARAQLNFQDERSVNPINTQIRFEAIVYNSRSHVSWEVRDLAGNPGAGSIDASGLYRAPPKGSLASGSTDVIVATSSEDPLRKAFAWVTLIGEGPWSVPAPSITIWPKRVTLYYPTGADNAYIDDSNKTRIFNATLCNSPTTQIEWLAYAYPTDPDVSTSWSSAGPNTWFRYPAVPTALPIPPVPPAPPLHPVTSVPPGLGDVTEVTIRVRLATQHSIFDEAKVIQLNYTWPGLH